MAIFGMGVMVGPTLGPTLGGWITDNYSWPWIFYINMPLGILAAVLTWRSGARARTPGHGATGVDWLGLALLILGIGALQILLERGESEGLVSNPARSSSRPWRRRSGSCCSSGTSSAPRTPS